MENPTKAEIAQVFKRLSSASANKLCFDCGSKNPTWSSVTYGVFICIDCSGIHRSLGVHLTFVKSTQLDHNWTWQQVRQMQLGGNANATSFFRQHNCNTTDTQLKYKSRAAQLYRDKLHGEAAKAMRVHGTKLFINTPQTEKEEENSAQKEDEADFFEKHSEETASFEASQSVSLAKSVSAAKSTASTDNSDLGAPNVEAALMTSPTAAAQMQASRKPTIGQRKPQNKKGGLGAKKTGGLGAQKVKKDFAEIEREAELADLGRLKAAEDAKIEAQNREENEAKAAASMRLAYQDLSLEQKKTEDKIRQLDPKKANQVERLGMGVVKKGGISHSAITEIATIDQEEPDSFKSFQTSTRKATNFEDDFEIIGDDWKSSTNNNSKFDFDSSPSASSNNWEKEFEVMKTTSKFDTKKSLDDNKWSNTFDEQPKRSTDRIRRPDTLNTAPSSGSIDMQKYGSAKAISSDMLFGHDQNSGPDANLNRFQGSSSISSAEYFGRQEVPQGRGMVTPDLDDVKESVRQGVSKVAGRLSNMASGALTQLQDKYGY